MALRQTIGPVEPKRMTDVFHWLANNSYNLEAITITNDTGAAITITDPVGYPVYVSGGVNRFCLAANDGDAKYLVMRADEVGGAITLADAETVDLVCLVRGPAIVKKGGIPTLDYAGGTLVAADIKAGLLANNILLIEDGSHEHTVSR